jgi:predicted alpha/beta hydrolase
MTALTFLLAAAALAAPAPRPVKKISLKTRDGWALVASYRAPRQGGVVMVLAHGVGSSRIEWDAFADRLAAAGVGTLAVDLRGHHDSVNGPKGARTYVDFDATGEWPKAVEDLDAAARWLEARGVSSSSVAFGGASIGANLAALAAAARPKTPFLLMLSPGPDYRGVELKRRRGLRALAVASPGDAYAFQTLKPLSTTGVETLEAPGGHGAQMLSDPATADKIVAWIIGR